MCADENYKTVNEVSSTCISLISAENYTTNVMNHLPKRKQSQQNYTKLSKKEVSSRFPKGRHRFHSERVNKVSATALMSTEELHH